MDVVIVLLAVSFILFFGFFSEFIFKKLSIPDVMFLIVLGFVLGPNVLGYISVKSIAGVAPIFTTFTLLFLLFDGAFNINLASLVREFSQSFALTTFNFIISAGVVFLVMWIAGFPILVSLLAGFTLGGVSSSFVIPILNQLKVSGNVYSLLTLEGALTDVFCIVFSLAVMEIINYGSFGIRQILTQLASLFAVAGLVGLIGGVVWIVLTLRVFKEHNYVMVVAYLLLIYVLTEFLKGNGAIAALFFGLMLKNSKQLSSIVKGIESSKSGIKKKAIKGDLGVSVTTPSEEYFYHQLSFLLKTFFFVYIGLLIDISDMKALLIGGILSLILMSSRTASLLLTRSMKPENRSLVNSMFARGLAAAVVAQLALQAGVPQAEFLIKVVNITITGTIILSSIRVLFVKLKMPALKTPKINKKTVNAAR